MKANPWSSWVEGDEGPNGWYAVVFLTNPSKLLQHIHDNVPYMSDTWADPVVHLLIQKCSMAKQWQRPLQRRWENWSYLGLDLQIVTRFGNFCPPGEFPIVVSWNRVNFSFIGAIVSDSDLKHQHNWNLLGYFCINWATFALNIWSQCAWQVGLKETLTAVDRKRLLTIEALKGTFC